MAWKKLGRVYVADGKTDWACSHAYVPTAYLIDPDRIRIYVAFLDRHKVGRIGYVDVDASNPLRILHVSENPILDIGRPGDFDDHGVTPVCIVPDRHSIYLYYVGWQLGGGLRYRLFLGLSVSHDGGETFSRHVPAQILYANDRERFLRSAGSVIRDGDRWKMWYVSGEDWIEVDNKQVPTYDLRYIESHNGLDWSGSGTLCLKTSGDDEFGFGRPFVIQGAALYRMWYSIRTRSKGYRLGYAESTDGLNWRRKDEEIGIGVSPDGWDSEMICFASVQKTHYGTYMFYNGNHYGETGFGVAVLNDS